MCEIFEDFRVVARSHSFGLVNVKSRYMCILTCNFFLRFSSKQDNKHKFIVTTKTSIIIVTECWGVRLSGFFEL